jgi:integrase/recombinase XerD
VKIKLSGLALLCIFFHQKPPRQCRILPSSSALADIGPEATKLYFEFFTVPIRNKNRRIAYYHAIGQFLDWCHRAGFRGLEDIEPITVAAYVEQHPGSPATIEQHMSAIRMLFSWLTEKGILAMNPAREVKTAKF